MKDKLYDTSKKIFVSVFIAILVFNYKASTAKCNINAWVEPYDSVPSVIYFDPTTPLFLSVSYSLSTGDCFGITQYVVFLNNSIYIAVPLDPNGFGTFNIQLSAPGIYTGADDPSGFTLNYLDTLQTGISPISSGNANNFNHWVDQNNDYLGYSSILPANIKLSIFNQLGQLYWQQPLIRTNYYLLNISDLGLAPGVYIMEAYIEDKRTSFKTIVRD
jgi:hypothetical protein